MFRVFYLPSLHSVSLCALNSPDSSLPYTRPYCNNGQHSPRTNNGRPTDDGNSRNRRRSLRQSRNKHLSKKAIKNLEEIDVDGQRHQKGPLGSQAGGQVWQARHSIYRNGLTWQNSSERVGLARDSGKERFLSLGKIDSFAKIRDNLCNIIQCVIENGHVSKKYLKVQKVTIKHIQRSTTHCYKLKLYDHFYDRSVNFLCFIVTFCKIDQVPFVRLDQKKDIWQKMFD